MAGAVPAGICAATSGSTALVGAAPMAGTAGAAETGSGAMVPMELAFGILALRARFSAAARLLRVWARAALRGPLASREAAFRLSMVSEAAAEVFTAWAPALRRPQATRAAAFRLSMALAAAGVFMALAAPEVFKAAAVEPSHSVDTEAAAIAELPPASRLPAWPEVPVMPSEGARLTPGRGARTRSRGRRRRCRARLPPRWSRAEGRVPSRRA